jgi:SMC interacting uncharacterized protein involved in chromosome segregation
MQQTKGENMDWELEAKIAMQECSRLQRLLCQERIESDEMIEDLTIKTRTQENKMEEMQKEIDRLNELVYETRGERDNLLKDYAHLVEQVNDNSLPGQIKWVEGDGGVIRHLNHKVNERNHQLIVAMQDKRALEEELEQKDLVIETLGDTLERERKFYDDLITEYQNKGNSSVDTASINTCTYMVQELVDAMVGLIDAYDGEPIPDAIINSASNSITTMLESIRNTAK